jgi:hypothetical protein
MKKIFLAAILTIFCSNPAYTQQWPDSYNMNDFNDSIENPIDTFLILSISYLPKSYPKGNSNLVYPAYENLNKINYTR